ncbi:nitroreductase family protein [Planotetraspora sp. GP83]|uniref:nitroreductase family protein n=1 Tax=Planotetraspora sp. GP83 TaxID=3156264 RepID=UPI0035181E93
MLDLSADEVLSTTRAVRRRLDLERPVDRRLIEECLEIAVQAPSGSNSQQWRFVVVGDPEVRGRIAEVYRKAFEDYRNSPYNAGNLFAGDPGRHAEQRRVFGSAEHLADNLHRVPYLLIPIAKGRCERLTTAGEQAAYWAGILPATWSFMLAARARGLGTAWTTMHLPYEREMAEIIGNPYEKTTQVALIPVAHTIGVDFRRARRQPVESVTHWDQW